MKKKAAPFPIPLRRILLIQLIVVILFASLHATFGRLSQRLYFPFERWPEGRAIHTPPPSERGRMDEYTDHLHRDEAKLGKVIDIFITRYMHFHKTQRFNVSSRKLIYTGEGNRHGLGDRFRGILNAYQLAFMTRRVLLLSWKEPFPLSVIFESAPGVSVMYDPAIDPRPLPLTPEEQADLNSTGSLTTLGAEPIPECWCNRAPLCTRDDPGILLSSARTVVVRAECSASMVGMLLSLRRRSDMPVAKEIVPALSDWRYVGRKTGLQNSIYPQVFRALLRPSAELVARLGGMYKRLRGIVPTRLRHFRQGSRHGYVAVHARLGHGIGELGTRFNLTMQGGSLKLVATCLARTAVAEAVEADLPEPQTFYLATDTPKFSRLFRREIGKWSKDARVEEMGLSVTHSAEMVNATAAEKEAFLDTAVDLFFLSAGDRLVSLPSGFANLARWFGDAPHNEKNVGQCVRYVASLSGREATAERCLFGC